MPCLREARPTDFPAPVYYAPYISVGAKLEFSQCRVAFRQFSSQTGLFGKKCLFWLVPIFSRWFSFVQFRSVSFSFVQLQTQTEKTRKEMCNFVEIQA